MSGQFLLSVIAQSVTLLHRGQTWTQFSTPRSHPEYYFAVIFSLLLHVGILYIRYRVRHIHSVLNLPRARERHHGMELYSEMDREVWIAMGIFSLLSVGVGFIVNWADKFSYQRHLQFLRLEFDTRLGMHSPR